MGEIADALHEYRKKFIETAPQQKQDDFEKGIAEVKKSGVEKKAINVGDDAPLFAGKDINGNVFSLQEQLTKTPVVLVWYRGGWCPYCNIYLNQIKNIASELKSNNVTLVAITPEVEKYAKETSEEKNYPFTVITDERNKIAKQFKVAYTLPGYISEYYKGFHINERNGDQSNVLPLSATYVIAKNRQVRFAFVDADYRNRAEISDIKKALDEL